MLIEVLDYSEEILQNERCGYACEYRPLLHFHLNTDNIAYISELEGIVFDGGKENACEIGGTIYYVVLGGTDTRFHINEIDFGRIKEAMNNGK